MLFKRVCCKMFRLAFLVTCRSSTLPYIVNEVARKVDFNSNKVFRHQDRAWIHVWKSSYTVVCCISSRSNVIKKLAGVFKVFIKLLTCILCYQKLHCTNESSLSCSLYHHSVFIIANIEPKSPVVHRLRLKIIALWDVTQFSQKCACIL